MTRTAVLRRLSALLCAGALVWLGPGAPAQALPAAPVPNLVGRWTVTGKGAVLCKVEASRCKTHHHGDFSDLEATVEITRQQGRLMHGVYRSKFASERFVATLGFDNRSFFLVDEDGFAEGRLIDGRRLEVVYRHSTDLDAVIDLSTWTRR